MKVESLNAKGLQQQDFHCGRTGITEKKNSATSYILDQGQSKYIYV